MKLSRYSMTIRLMLFLAIFLVLNLLAYRVFFRLDFTADQRYTLSKVTKDLLRNLEDPVTITAYFSEDLPPNVASTRQDFRDMLYEFRSISGGKVVFEFVNPNEDEQKEMEVQQMGIAPILLSVRERDKSEQIRAYLGAVVKLGNQQEVIPFFRPGDPQEYPLTRAIKRLSITEKPKVGFVQGHGEPGREALAAALQELNILYEPDTVSLANPSRWSEFKTLVILAPQDSFSAGDLAQLDLFLEGGGRLFVGINAVGGDLSQRVWNRINTGLESWLTEKGITVEPTFLTDARCGQITVQQRQGFFVMNTPVSFPFIPLITNYSDHPITQGLEAVSLLFASPVTITTNDSSLKTGVLAYSSEQSGKIPPPASFNIDKRWSEADFPYRSLPVAVFAEGKMVGEGESKLVVVGDGDFATMGEGGGGPSNNLNLLVNSIDWLTDDTGLIELRTRGVESRLIEKQLSDGERMAFKYGFFLLPILIAIVFGVFRFQIRRTKRLAWMEKDYS